MKNLLKLILITTFIINMFSCDDDNIVNTYDDFNLNVNFIGTWQEKYFKNQMNLWLDSEYFYQNLNFHNQLYTYEEFCLLFGSSIQDDICTYEFYQYYILPTSECVEIVNLDSENNFSDDDDIPMYIEKPIAYKYDDLELIYSMPNELQERSFVGLMMRYHPVVKYLLELDFGPRIKGDISIGHDVNQWRDDWLFSKSYAADKDGGGVLLDLCHEIDLVMLLKKDLNIQNVFSYGHRQYPGIDIDTTISLSSEELDFEKAAIFRDRIKSLNIIQSSQRINEANLVEADVIAGYKESGKTCIQVFFYRSKQNWGNQAFFPKHDPDEKLSNILNSFVSQFYENKNVPSIIILSEDIKEKNLIEKTLSKKESKQVNISIAKKGSKLKVINQAIKNAKDSLNRKLYESQNNKDLFDSISKKFNLEANISLIEVYDNSHIQGTNSVGALIAFGDEGFIKKRYRKFNIKKKDNEQDDYGMMREVLNRRFKRAIQEKDNFLSFPDLVMIDGGKGQYSSARETMNELGLHDIPVIAIAKGKYRNSGDETFFHNGKDYKFEKNDPTLFFLQRIRDESHRFAISAHRAKRKKGITKSLLDQIQGVGSMRKRALLNHFGSARAVESASLDEIKSVDGVEEKVAKKIYNFFHE